MQWIICYDISCDKSRRKAHRLLKKHSGGYQNSGFEAQMSNQSDIHKVLEELHSYLTEQDKLLFLKHPGYGPDWALGVGICSQPKNLIFWV